MFGKDSVKIIHNSSKIVLYSGECNKKKRLWYFNMVEMLKLKIPTTDISLNSILVIKNKQPRISSDKIEYIRWLHERLFYTVSPSAMAKVVENKALLGLPVWLTAELVLRVFNNYLCIVCLLAKMKHITTSNGSEIYSGVPGQ